MSALNTLEMLWPMRAISSVGLTWCAAAPRNGFDSMSPEAIGFHKGRSVAELAAHSQDSCFRCEKVVFWLLL